MRPILPDVLLTYPVDSLCIWRYGVFQMRKKRSGHMHYKNVLARVTGKPYNQGNKILSIIVFFIEKNPFGENVLYIRRKPYVNVKNIMTIEAWKAQRAGGGD